MLECLILLLAGASAASAGWTCDDVERARRTCPAGSCDCEHSTFECVCNEEDGALTLTSNSQACHNMQEAAQAFAANGGAEKEQSVTIAPAGTVGARFAARMRTGIVGMATNGIPIASAWERSALPLDQSSVAFDQYGGHNFGADTYQYHCKFLTVFDLVDPASLSFVDIYCLHFREFCVHSRWTSCEKTTKLAFVLTPLHSDHSPQHRPQRHD